MEFGISVKEVGTNLEETEKKVKLSAMEMKNQLKEKIKFSRNLF